MKPTELSVEAGAQVTCTVTVRNLGTIVERFALEVRGDAAPWATVEPATVSLLPGHEREVVVHFHPPREPVPCAGTIPFAVLAVPKEGSGDSAAEEGELQVLPFFATTAGMRPRTSRGVRMGRHVVRIHNGGNAPMHAQLVARDPDDLLSFKVLPPELDLAPGRLARVRLQAKPRRVRDAPIQRPFQVTIDSGPDQNPVKVDGFMQKRKVSLGWIPKALGVIVVLAVAVVVLAGIEARPIDKSKPAAAVAAAKAKAKAKTAKKKSAAKKPTKKKATTKKPTKKPVKHTTTTTTRPGSTTTTTTLPTPQSANTAVLTAASTSPTDVKCFTNPAVDGTGQLTGTDSIGTPTSLRTFTVPADATNVSTLAQQSADVCFVGQSNGTDSLTQLTVWIPKNPTPGTVDSSTIAPPTCLPYTPGGVTLDDTTIDTTTGLPKFAVRLLPAATDPNGFLLFNDDASAKAAFAYLQSEHSLCWIGSATSPISAVTPFNWTTAVSYFQ